MMEYCVYKHTSPKNKVYIGITKLKPEYRWNNGFGYQKNTYFWKAIQKYGWDNFKHEILYDKLSQKEACEKEKELIAFYDSTNPQKGYNITTGGNIGYSVTRISEKTLQKKREAARGEKNPMYGKHHSEESRKKIGQNRVYPRGKDHPSYGKPFSGRLSLLAHPVVQLDKNGIFIASYESEAEAARQTGASSDHISECCDNIYKSAGGFIWISQALYDPNINYQYQRRTTGRPVVQLDKNYTYINEFPNIRTAEQVANVPHKVSECCRHVRKSCGGFIWMYKDEYLDFINNYEGETICN